MKSKNAVLITAAILLIAFITNPRKQKHIEKASEIFSGHLTSKGENDLLTVALGSWVGTMFGYKMDIDNYLFFTTSSVYSQERNETLLCGVGLFGQVVWVASEKDIEDFTSDHEEKGVLKSPGKQLEKSADLEEIDPALRAVFQ